MRDRRKGGEDRRDTPRRLSGVPAERIAPQVAWKDMVLPPATLQQLEALAGACRVRSGKAVTALFAGPEGVGKAMAAQAIAGELGAELLRVDLGRVVSKDIGETEKNLQRVFKAAEATQAILFFDGADALFGKRTEIRDSHDRYANVEVSYLLERTESFDGVAILTAKLRHAIDPALAKRLSHLIDFPFPAAAERRELWRRCLASGAAATGADFDRLSLIELTGGGIARAAAEAARAAAAEGATVTASHAERAAKAAQHGRRDG